MKPISILAVVLTIASCASPGQNYQPIIDRPSASFYADLNDCRTHAAQTAGPGGGAAVGAGVGAGLGLLLCSALGGRDCGRTATGTAILGAAHGAGAGYRDEATVVRTCLLGRGHRVLN